MRKKVKIHIYIYWAGPFAFNTWSETIQFSEDFTV